MYNRTLTPTGLPERASRPLGRPGHVPGDVAVALVPTSCTGALLMYHCMEDQNVGTDTISSVRMMQALRAQGKNAALYMYPYEDHGPATRETNLDQWARWTAWLDIYVKNAGKKTTKVVQ